MRHNSKNKIHQKIKTRLHPSNKHRNHYNFKQLCHSCTELAQYVKLNIYQNETIDFFNPKAVKSLNKALLKTYYNIEYWDIPPNYLCPPIPGRADYIHHIADLLSSTNNGKIPIGHNIKCLDIGVGANCVYPIIGNKEYGWSFIGSDIDPIAVKSANKIIEKNPLLHGKIEIRLQKNLQDFFYGILKPNEHIDISICNPPFHSSAEEARAGTLRKLSNLNHKKISNAKLNFGGQSNELWCDGGEEKFVHNMIQQSKQFSTSCFWFTTLISKQSNLKSVYKELNKVKAVDVKTIPMAQGNKISRIVAWTFH